MSRFAKIVANLAALLIISGMMLHEMIPHHHHTSTGEVQTCCESHHKNDANNHSEKPCTILTNIHFENFKPQISVFSQELNHNHSNGFNAICPQCHIQVFGQTLIVTPIFIPEAVFYETEFHTSYSLRGPPSLLV
jgi:hypothetical protein